MALLNNCNGAPVSHAGDVSASGAHNGLASGGQGRRRWKEAHGYDRGDSQNNGTRKDYFLGRPGVSGNVQPEAHKDMALVETGI